MKCDQLSITFVIVIFFAFRYFLCSADVLVNTVQLTKVDRQARSVVSGLPFMSVSSTGHWRRGATGVSVHNVTDECRTSHSTLLWRHNGRDGVSNHQPHHCLLNRLFRRIKSLAFVRGIRRWPVNSPHKGPVTRKMFSFGDAIMNDLIP